MALVYRCCGITPKQQITRILLPMKKIACLIPGIGYTCDKPLLYYSWKLLKGLGWEVVPVPYTGFPPA